MSSYSRPLGLVWTRNPEMPGLRVSTAVFGVVYPALYFLTSLEDPGRAEPFWQYQIVGALFLAVGAASFTAWGKQRLQTLYHGAFFAAWLWSLASQYLRGYEGTRFALSTVMFCGGLFVLSPLAMIVHPLLIVGGVALGVSLHDPPIANSAQLIARVALAAVVVTGITSIRLSIRDREARRAKSLRSIVQGSPVPTLLLSNDVCQLANDAATRLLGILPGHNVREILVGEPPWWIAREPSGRAQAQLRSRHGSELWCEVAFAPVEEQPHLIQVTLVDKTSDRDLSRIKDELLASISRELRPPLLSVKRALRASDGSEAAGQRGPEASRAMRDLDRIERLLEDMLLIHSLTGDAARDERRAYPAAEVCEQARALVEAYADALDVTLSVHCPAERALAVRTDMQAAGHALAILVTMALDAADAAGGRVSVRVEPKAPWIGYSVETESPALEGAPPASDEAAASLPLTIARSLVTRVGGLLDVEWPAAGRKTLSMRLPAA